MEIRKINDILPQMNQTSDILTHTAHDGLIDSISFNTDSDGIDYYENLNLITFEKSLSRLRGNYSLQLKVHSLGESDHHQ